MRLIFGASSSPSCAIHILHTCAEDNKLNNPEACSAIRHYFHINDYLQSFNTTKNAAITTTELKVRSKRWLKAYKKYGNDTNTVRKTPGDNADTKTEQRILEQSWNASEDVFIFRRPDIKLDVNNIQERQLLFSR